MKGRRGKIYQFAEGAMTVAEFRMRCAPRLADCTIREHLAAGRNSALAMLAYVPVAKAKKRSDEQKKNAQRWKSGVSK